MFDGFAKKRKAPPRRSRRANAGRALEAGEKKVAPPEEEQEAGGCFSWFGGASGPGPGEGGFPSPDVDHAKKPLLQAEPPAGKARRLNSTERLERYIDATAERVETHAPQCAQFLHTFKPMIAIAIEFGVWVVQFSVWLYFEAYKLYCMLPLDEMRMVTGLLLCFFGGTFEVTIAAAEAFRTMGGQRLYEQVEYVFEQAKIVYEAELKDAELDENHNNIPDVDEIQTKELAARKVKVAMMAVDEPERLQSAVGALWSACVAVLAALNVKFAMVSAYALAFADMIRFPVTKALAPIVAWSLGPELTHWVETFIDSALRFVCLIGMWYLEKVRAAFYSGLRGGKMFADGLFELMIRKGWIEELPDWLVSQPFNPDESRLDEMITYPLALCGLYWQITTWFHIPFPLDWVLWPVQILEDTLIAMLVWGNVTS